MTSIRGIRGANTVNDNTPSSILGATRELLLAMVRENDVQVKDIVSIFFTLTPDLNAEFPALAARDMGWSKVPLLCAAEIDVPGAKSGCLRILMHVQTSRSLEEIRHVYLGETALLRPDLAQ
ncbi:MAG: chorismate mutase [Candidatus Desulforudis sp.]|nr:chorismate mutase [Desulforudis sp.]